MSTPPANASKSRAGGGGRRELRYAFPMKPRLIPLTAALLLAVSPFVATATTIYKCKNEKGEIYFAQSFDPARCAGGGAEINERGIAVREIERLKTPEERAVEKAAAEIKAESERLKLAQQQADRVLMMSFPNESDLARANDQQLQVIEAAVTTARLQMGRHEEQLADLLARAADAERAGGQVPADLTASIDVVREQIEQQRAFITRKLAERAQSNLEFTLRVIRYRELRERQQQLFETSAG